MKSHLLLIIGILLVLGTMGALGQNQRRPAQQARGFVTVQVTGKGESLELAQEDAKRNALARVVGEAIKARTDIIENGDDAQVFSQYIAASAGFIAKFDETATANENGIFSVTANVTVYGERLLEAVTFGNDSIEAAKEMQQARVGSDMEARREALTKYITSYMLDYCRIWSISAKELIPDYDNNGQPVLHANCYFGTTPAKYQMYIRRLETAMARLGATRSKFIWDNYKNCTPIAYYIKPDNPKNFSFRDNGLFIWIPKKFLEPKKNFQDEFNKYGYKFTFKLLDENGNVILTKQFGHALSQHNSFLPIPETGSNGTADPQLNLMPLIGDNTKTCYRRKYRISFNEFASAEEMLKVKRMVASVELVKKVREPTLKFGVFGWNKKDYEWIEH